MFIICDPKFTTHHFLTFYVSWEANNNYKDKIFVSYSNKKTYLINFLSFDSSEIWFKSISFICV
jgi:hypothetical protein